MPFVFTDGFDCYSASADAILGYWDSGTTTWALVAGRFSGSRALSFSSTGQTLVKTSPVATDAVHHISVAFMQTLAISGTTLGLYFQLSDGATNQVCIVFRSDGAILLTSATPGGTVLATYAGAVTANNTWYHFEFEVVINNASGSFKVRKNGNVSDDHSTTGINTRPGANTQASKLTLAEGSILSTHVIDDLIWQSSSSAGSWIGETRCRTRMPAADAGVQWTRSGAGTVNVAQFTPGSAFSTAINTSHFTAFIPPVSGTIGLVTFSCTSSGSVASKAAIYASAAGVPTTVLGTATENAAMTGGTMQCVFTTPVSVTAGVTYFVAMNASTTAGGLTHTQSVQGPSFRAGVTYSSFPNNNPTGLSVNSVVYALTVWLTPGTPANWPYVSEQQQDAASSYVYSSNVGDTDRYAIAPIDTTPASTFCVTTRALLQKSDAGTRNTSVLLKSGSTEVATPSAALPAGSWAWQYRVDTVDPATGSAWTAVGVANALIGVTVTA